MLIHSKLIAKFLRAPSSIRFKSTRTSKNTSLTLNETKSAVALNNQRAAPSSNHSNSSLTRSLKDKIDLCGSLHSSPSKRSRLRRLLNLLKTSIGQVFGSSKRRSKKCLRRPLCKAVSSVKAFESSSASMNLTEAMQSLLILSLWTASLPE